MNQAITPQRLIIIVGVLEASVFVLEALYYNFPPLGEQRSDRDNLIPIFYDLHCWFAELGSETVADEFGEDVEERWDGHWRIRGSDYNVHLFTDLKTVYGPRCQPYPCSVMIYGSSATTGYCDDADFEWQTRDGQPVILLECSNWPEGGKRWVCPKDFFSCLKAWITEILKL